MVRTHDYTTEVAYTVNFTHKSMHNFSAVLSAIIMSTFLFASF